jgi:hypothetical protein
MKKNYEAIENFETPSRGAIKKGMRIELDEKDAQTWVKAGMIFEVKEVKPQEKKTEVRGNG